MEISELFDDIRDAQDSKGYSGAISTRPVKVENEDGDLFDIHSMYYNNTLGTYIIRVVEE